MLRAAGAGGARIMPRRTTGDAFVGKPCDIAALRNLARWDARVDELVRYWLAPVCGGFMPPHGMDRFPRDREGLDRRARGYRGFGQYHSSQHERVGELELA